MKLALSIARGTSTAIGAAILLFSIYEAVEAKLDHRRAVRRLKVRR